MKTEYAILTLLLVLVQSPLLALDMPTFLPEYYSPAFSVGSRQLMRRFQAVTNGVDRAVYATADEALALSVENISCDRPRSEAIFSNIAFYINNTIAANSGRFVVITKSEINAELVVSNVAQSVFVYVLPASVQIWTFSTGESGAEKFSGKFELIRGFVDRQRYSEALASGNVSMGVWGSRIHDYAIHLIETGKRREGLAVLRNHLSTSPFDYDGHVVFFENTDDSTAAANSAEIVFKNAEKEELINKSAEFLGNPIANLNAIPLLNTNETGLQLVIVPLPPCNPWLLNEAASTFEQCTGVPAKVRRLDGDWSWTSPERTGMQREIQRMLVRLRGKNIDFAGWKKKRYVDELKSVVKTRDALSARYVFNLIEELENDPGQYFASPYLDRLSKLLAPMRSDDNRTMYVGVTQANIYSGDSNYIFSLCLTGGESRAGILSYHMMLGETLDEAFQSRKRLIERIAKELVPVSLSQLSIPRSIDPTCPYSYASGVTRLDQKTLKLSKPVRDALDRFREPTK